MRPVRTPPRDHWFPLRAIVPPGEAGGTARARDGPPTGPVGGPSAGGRRLHEDSTRTWAAVRRQAAGVAASRVALMASILRP